MSPEQVVHLIDDDDAVRESLEFLFRTASIAVRAYNSPLLFMERLPDAEPGCVVTDVRMPEMTGIELLQRLRDIDSALPVIVMTGHGDIPLAVETMKLGAFDFLEKPFADETILSAVRSAFGSQAGAAGEAGELADIFARLAELSPRERQVLDGVVAGQPNKIVAFNLGISPRTVEIYRANVMTKMRAGNLSDLVRMTLIAERSSASKGARSS
ncbi:MAG: response regulator FixJ [Rhodoblastus sp.]|mgnify:CR=1 FL=1